MWNGAGGAEDRIADQLLVWQRPNSSLHVDAEQRIERGGGDVICACVNDDGLAGDVLAHRGRRGLVPLSIRASFVALDAASCTSSPRSLGALFDGIILDLGPCIEGGYIQVTLPSCR